ncbi:MAG: M48 family metallopeptidase [Thiohalomonadaceae bacterium]
MTEVQGHYYDGKTSASEAVTLRIQGQQWLLEGAQGSRHYPLEQVEVANRLGNTARHLSFPDGGRFETTDNDGIDALLHSVDRAGSSLWLHRLESHMRYVVLGVVVSIAFVWALVAHGLPAAAKAVAMQMPVSISTGLSEQVLAQLDERFFAPSQLPAETQYRLQQRFANVIAPVEQGFQFQLLFRQGGPRLGANAFALPSGLILMTDELVKLAEHDDELVAIMAHEVGHVVYRHGLRQVLQHTALGLVMTYLTGDVSSLVGALPVMLMQLGYSRAFEREADRYALDYLRSQNIPSAHFAHIMQRLDKQHDQEPGIGNYLSTHPATSERIQPFLGD